MTNYICDTAKECGSKTCNYRLALPEHARLMPQLGFMCVKAGHRVYPELVAPTCCAMESHTCYFCDHTGIDVNRIACMSIVFNHAMDERAELPNYCCDDAVACDERWQALQGDDLAGEVGYIILEEALREWGLGVLASAQLDIFRKRATARIMKLIELPF